MKTDIGVPAGIPSPAKTGVFSQLQKRARAISLVVLGLIATANEAKAAVTVIPGTLQANEVVEPAKVVIPGTYTSTMSAPTAQIFSQYGPGQDKLAEERSTTPGRFDMFIGSSIVDSHFSVVDILISETDGVAGGRLSIPWHLSLEGIPSDDTDTAITVGAELMCSVDGRGAVTLSQLGESMQIGFMDGLHPIDIKSTGNYFIDLSPGAHNVKVIAFHNSDWANSNLEGEVRPEFTPNVPEPSSTVLAGGAAGLLLMRRRRNPTMTA